MVNRDILEKALLLGVVREQNWNIMILNNISIDYFSIANHALYKYIKECVDKDIYPQLKLLGFQYNIDDVTMQECLEVTNLNEICDVLRDEYLKDKLNYNIGELNEYSDEMNTNPQQYIDRIGQVYNRLKQISYHSKAVSLFDDIEKVLTIDDADVISTGFKELDEKLVGWKRGEELVIFMGRTGQGKSWMGLKFAMAAALSGEKVGIYSGEMSTQQLQERIVCCAKQTYSTTKEEAIDYIKSKNIDIKVLTQKELRRRANIDDIEEFIVSEHLSLLVVDQLSLMEDITSRPGTPLRQQYGNISMDLFTLSSRYQLPIILLVQSNRQGSDQKDGPMLENIAESDAVAQNATRVISMKNEGGVLTLNILKNRYGSNKLIQRYDVDYGINKYKPIQDYSSLQEQVKHNVKRSTFL